MAGSSGVGKSTRKSFRMRSKVSPSDPRWGYTSPSQYESSQDGIVVAIIRMSSAVARLWKRGNIKSVGQDRSGSCSVTSVARSASM